MRLFFPRVLATGSMIQRILIQVPIAALRALIGLLRGLLRIKLPSQLNYRDSMGNLQPSREVSSVIFTDVNSTLNCSSRLHF